MAPSLYQAGPFSVILHNIDPARKPAPQSPPRPLIVALPTAAQLFPVVVLQHGFLLRNEFYTQLMSHVASHGYIVLAPEMYEFITGPDASAEIEAAAAVLDWLPENLAASLPRELSGATPDVRRLVLSGHSRGGKVAFGVALGKAKLSAVKLSGLAGFDPVDGVSETMQTHPPIVNSSPHSFQLNFPTLLVGTGLGSEKISPDSLLPVCAPENFGHKAFYRCSSSPTYYFVAAEFGHMDFLNDDTPGAEGKLSHCLCKNGSSRAPLRTFSGAILVAFLRALFSDDAAGLEDTLKHPQHANIRLSTAESYETNPVKAEFHVLRA